MEDIKILKLVTGEDIICKFIKISTESYAVMNPMVIAIKYKGNSSNLVMAHWLPVEIIKKNEMLMHPRDILAIVDPIDDVAEYYDTMIENLNKMMKAKFTPSEFNNLDEMEDIREALKQSERSIIH
jgi:hypothetical protein